VQERASGSKDVELTPWTLVVGEKTKCDLVDGGRVGSICDLKET
jgi:hypothetical protein